MMRSFRIGLGILALVIAAILALRDNSGGTAPNKQVSALPTVGKQESAARITPPVASTPPAGKQVFFVSRGDGIAAFNSDDGRLRYYLPRGFFSADEQHFYWTRFDPNGTAIVSQDVATGGPAAEPIVIKGEWDLGGVSASGRWLALRDAPRTGETPSYSGARRLQTQIAIVDASLRSLNRVIHLEGDFDIDAISNDGSSLFLIEHLADQHVNRYAVRRYDLVSDKLVPGSVRIKNESEDMVGETASKLASPDGHWLLTLYINTEKKEAFIHALDISEQYAMCFDLPSGSGNLDQLKQYTLALSPDGGMLYAANPALGVIAEQPLDGERPGGTIEFGASMGANSAPDFYAPGRWSVVSPDGAFVYFTDGARLWALDVQASRVAGPLNLDKNVAALGMKPTGRRLFVVTTKPGPTLVFNPDEIPVVR